MNCSRIAETHRYYDNELAPEERQGVEEHFAQCEECRRLFQELCCLSRLLTRAAPAEAPADLVVELRRSTEPVRNRTIIRLASWLTAAAAAVLVGALVTWPTSEEDVNSYQGLSRWEIFLTTPIGEGREDSGWENSFDNFDGTLTAQWMADQFSLAGNGDMR